MKEDDLENPWRDCQMRPKQADEAWLVMDDDDDDDDVLSLIRRSSYKMQDHSAVSYRVYFKKSYLTFGCYILKYL